jgi:PIN domain nuclease of toxin-antitoxin system
MNTYLIDSHVWLWAASDPHKLSSKATRILRDPDCKLALSLASVWEIAIKVSKGKLSLSSTDNIDRVVLNVNADLGVSLLSITLEHIHRTHELPWLHKDPFDRMLIAQAISLNIPIITADPHFNSYPIEAIW